MQLLRVNIIYIIPLPGQPDNSVNGAQQNSSGDLEEMVCADIAEHDTVSVVCRYPVGKVQVLSKPLVSGK